MEYTVSTNNIHIIDSYKTSKHDFNTELKKIQDADGDKTIVFEHRSYKSLRREWACHNLAYNCHILRSHAKDVDLNYPQKWYVALFYNIVGRIALLLIP